MEQDRLLGAHPTLPATVGGGFQRHVVPKY